MQYFQVISDLVDDFMNFNALKIILKIHKKIFRENSRPDTRTRESTSTYMQDKR